MGYFSNGTEGDRYEVEYCRQCVHFAEDDGGCAVMLAHLLYNYDDAFIDILNLLIPMTGIKNEQCAMYFAA